MADVLFMDLAIGKLAFEVDIDAEFSNEPEASIVPIEGGRRLEETVRSNIRWLADQGYTSLEIFAVEGFGTLYLRSRVLEPMRHKGFDYDSQYQGDPNDGELVVPEEEAKQRYYSVGDVLPTVIREAHALGLTVTANIESLAHIINRATSSGIGGGSDSLIISGNLPVPTVKNVLAFVDEVIGTGADAISAEAYSEEYDRAIAEHLQARGVPYVHAGADLGTMWSGYYYSFYPDDPQVQKVYTFLHTYDSVLGTTNGTIFARARAVSPRPKTAVVVGAYNPLPCNTSISIADLYSLQRSDPDAPPIDEESPSLADGTAVENCATGPWKNLLLVAARRQGVNRIWLTADLKASLEATSRAGIGREILERIASHPAPGTPLPVANIVVDIPEYTADDSYGDAMEFFEAVSVVLVGLVDDALQAAGYQTVLTYDRPWDGGTPVLTYILTAGGNEDTGDGNGMGPPYWSSAQVMQSELLGLIDPKLHPGPVIIHPVFGVPDVGSWQDIRRKFGLPGRFAYRNPTLSQYEGYHMSLLTSFPVTPEGEVTDGLPQEPIIPDSGLVLGHTMHLRPYTDFYGLGQVANLVGLDELPQGSIVAAGPLLVPGSNGDRREENAPYMVTDGQGRFLWLINQLHHEAFTYIIGQAIAQATGRSAVLAEPAAAHVWSGPQTFALAYDKTEVSLRLPFKPGQPIDITVYDIRSNPVREESGVPYHEPVRVSLDKYSLLVVEPAR
jgi:hypothetical protein